MRILVVGAAGTIGTAVVENLSRRHEVLAAGRSSKDFPVDMTSPDSIRALYARIGTVDAVVSAAGHVKFGPLGEMAPDDYRIGLEDKLMGQVNLVLLGLGHVSEGGSFTLTTGILNRDPIVGGTSAAMVNGALDAFVAAAAIELPRGLRINGVSPTLLDESAEALGSFFPGFETVPGARVALAYRKAVEGRRTGLVFCVP